MKRFLLSLVILFGLLAPVAVPAATYAVDIFPGCNNGGALNNTSVNAHVCTDVNSQSGSSSNPIIGTLKKVMSIIALAIGVAAVIILVISGLRMVLDGGDPKAAAQARTGIIYALAGIAVAVLAQAIVIFVLNRVG